MSLEQMSLELDGVEVVEHEPEHVLGELLEIVSALIDVVHGIESQQKIQRSLIDILELDVDRLKEKVAGHESDN